jgi:hypothetical protein
VSGTADNSLLSTAANQERWAADPDRVAATAPARQAFRDRFVEQARENGSATWRPTSSPVAPNPSVRRTTRVWR